MMHKSDHGLQDNRLDVQSSAESIHRIVKNTDVACPHCGYNLRDLHTKTCIECGETLNVRELLRGAELPRTGEYLLLQISLSLWLVFAAILIPVAPLLARRGSALRPLLSIAAMLLLALCVWITVRMLNRPRSLVHLSRPARAILRVFNAATVALAVFAVGWFVTWLWRSIG